MTAVAALLAACAAEPETPQTEPETPSWVDETTPIVRSLPPETEPDDTQPFRRIDMPIAAPDRSGVVETRGGDLYLRRGLPRMLCGEAQLSDPEIRTACPLDVSSEAALEESFTALIEGLDADTRYRAAAGLMLVSQNAAPDVTEPGRKRAATHLSPDAFTGDHPVLPKDPLAFRFALLEDGAERLRGVSVRELIRRYDDARVAARRQRADERARINPLATEEMRRVREMEARGDAVRVTVPGTPRTRPAPDLPVDILSVTMLPEHFAIRPDYLRAAVRIEVENRSDVALKWPEAAMTLTVLARPDVVLEAERTIPLGGLRDSYVLQPGARGRFDMLLQRPVRSEDLPPAANKPEAFRPTLYGLRAVNAQDSRTVYLLYRRDVD